MVFPKIPGALGPSVAAQRRGDDCLSNFKGLRLIADLDYRVVEEHGVIIRLFAAHVYNLLK